MTIGDNVTKSGPYTCDGVNKRFDYTFRIVDEDNIDVVIISADSSEVILARNEYTVFGVGQEDGYIITDSALAADKEVEIRLSPPLKQPTSLRIQGAYNPETVEKAIDRAVLMIRSIAGETYSGANEGGGVIGTANGIPVGGTTGQALVKSSGTNYDVEWANVAGGGASDHGALSGLSDDDHPQYYNQARGDARYYTKTLADSTFAGVMHNHAASDITSGQFANARISEASVTQHAAAITIAASQVSDFSEATDDRVAALLVGGTDINVTYDDVGNAITIDYTGGGGGGSGTWDLKSLKVDYSATGDGVANDSTPISNAVAGGEPFYVPDGTYKGTTIAATDLTQRFYGDGQIETSDGNKRGRFFSLVDAAPASEGSTDSINTAFDGDMSGNQFPIEHRITGANTLGTPATGYKYTHETSALYLHLRNESGHNESLSGNNGRTAATAMTVKVDNHGQGDCMAYNFFGFVTGTKSGSTNFLANPACGALAGTLTAGQDGVYLNPLEFDLQDSGNDAACVGTVINLARTNGTGAKEATWQGHRVQSLGSADCDVAYSASGKIKIGIDFVGANFNAAGGNRAITMKAGQRIYFNATSTIPGAWYANNSGNESLFYDSGKMVLAVGGQPVIQAQQSNVILAPSGTGTLKASSQTVEIYRDLQVKNSGFGGSNFFRVSSAGVVCTAQLSINGRTIYFGTCTANFAGGSSGEYLLVQTPSGLRKIELLYENP